MSPFPDSPIDDLAAGSAPTDPARPPRPTSHGPQRHPKPSPVHFTEPDDDGFSDAVPPEQQDTTDTGPEPEDTTDYGDTSEGEPEHDDGGAAKEETPPPDANPDDEGVALFSVDALLSFNPDDDSARIIGEKRYLCAGGSMIINGQAGIGKSSLVMQAAVSWALGRDLFGIKAVKPLRVLIAQRENDLGDMAEEVQGVIKGLRLTGGEVDSLRQRLVVLQESCRSGPVFAAWLKRKITEHKPDFVICDPLFAFALSVEQKDLTPFLRSFIQPILNETGCIICFVHHANKPPKDATYGMGMSEQTKKYMGSGSMETTNWARAVLTIIPAVEAENIFELCAAKRGGRAGMTDAQGNPAKSIYIRHATDGIYWERAGAFEEAEKRRKQEAEEAKRKKASNAERDGLAADATPTAAEIVEVMGADSWAPGALKKKLCAHFDIKPRKAEYRIEACRADGTIIKAPGKRGEYRAAFPKTD